MRLSAKGKEEAREKALEFKLYPILKKFVFSLSFGGVGRILEDFVLLLPQLSDKNSTFVSSKL